MFDARYCLRGNRITKNKSDAAVHCFDALPVSTGILLYSAFRSHRKGQANQLDFRIPIAIDAPGNGMRSFLPPHVPHIPYLRTKYSLHISQCSYLTLFHIIYLPSTTLNLDFFGSLSETKSLEPTFV
jgi:hypothetical protein